MRNRIFKSSPTDQLRFGLRDVTISSINPMHNDVGTVYIYGSNFTPYSKVYINDEKVDTIYIDKDTLIVMNPELKSGDNFVVKQQNSDTHVLSETKKFTYTNDETNVAKEKATKKHKKKHKKK